MDYNGQVEVIARGILVQAGHVLLCRNRKWGHSYLPGGHVEFDEAASAALARELMEEAGLPVRVGEPVLAGECAFDQAGRRRHEVDVVFRMALASGTPEGGNAPAAVRSLESKLAFDWVPIEKLGTVNFKPEWMLGPVAELARRPELTGVRWVSAFDAGA